VSTREFLVRLAIFAMLIIGLVMISLVVYSDLQ